MVIAKFGCLALNIPLSKAHQQQIKSPDKTAGIRKNEVYKSFLFV